MGHDPRLRTARARCDELCPGRTQSACHGNVLKGEGSHYRA
jgi:hypothetical protein